MITLETKSVRTEGRDQFVNYTEHLHGFGSPLQQERFKEGAGKFAPDHVLRLRIVVGGYASQSYGVIERWNGIQWREVATIKGEALAVDLHVGYRFKELSESARACKFSVDRDTLLKLALEVL